MPVYSGICARISGHHARIFRHYTCTCPACRGIMPALSGHICLDYAGVRPAICRHLPGTGWYAWLPQGNPACAGIMPVNTGVTPAISGHVARIIPGIVPNLFPDLQIKVLLFPKVAAFNYLGRSTKIRSFCLRKENFLFQFLKDWFNIMAAFQF